MIETTQYELNQNPNEVEKFNQLSAKWWDPEGPLKTLHQINPLRLAFIQQQINLKNKKILDIGCGGGILTESLAEFGQMVTGIDLAEDSLKVAEKHAASLKNPPQYIKISAEEFAESNNEAFDVITCMELLEHVPNPPQLLQAISTLIKPGGSVFVSTLNRTLKAYCQAIIGAEYILNMLPKGTHDYKAFIKPSELRNMAKNLNLTLHTAVGIKYHPFKQSFSLTNDLSVNYLLHFTRDKE